MRSDMWVLGGAVEDSLERLDSDWVEASLGRDPYWPKFDSPWWHMVLLWELGEAARIPSRAVEAMVRALDSHYLHVFPFTAAEVPAGVDPLMQVMCHCGLATMYRVLSDCGVDVDAALPWARPWFGRYQMADGGWNCDEGAYLRVPQRSSFVSTVPVLEALLFAARGLTDAEEAMLDRGAAWLLERRLCRSLSKGGIVADEAWLTPVFPRFYEYDVLRGLEFLWAWSARRGSEMSHAAVADAVAAIRQGRVRDFTASASTRLWDGHGWARGPASTFPLLDAARQIAPDILDERRAAVLTSAIARPTRPAAGGDSARERSRG